MNRRAVVVLSCTLSLGLTGCAVHEVHKDHDKIRAALLDMYTDQVMDNLILAYNRMPLVQVDYTRLVGQVTIKNTVGGSDNQAATASNVLALPAATLSATRNIVTTLAGNLGNENTNQVTIEAMPVTTSNEVYDAYLQFLDPDKNPGSLMATCDPPPPGAAHICRKVHKIYYWVPVVYRDQFYALSVLTTVQRGKPLSTPDVFFSLTTTLLKDEVNQIFPDQHVLTLQLSRPIPADVGFLTLDNDKSGRRFTIQATAPKGQSNVQTLTLDVDAEGAKLFAAPQPAKVYLEHQRPKAPTTEDLLNRNNFLLQQIQYNQLR
jgi:hypothetical protein